VVTGKVGEENTSNYYGGGIYVDDGATLEMLDGSAVKGSFANSGGGVYATGGSGTFRMTGGEISGNVVSRINGLAEHGGGVFIEGARSFEMSGNAVIKDNIASNAGYGGGVTLKDGGSFLMSENAVISGNRAYLGGGVELGDYSGDLTMTGGTIYGKNAETSMANVATGSAPAGAAIYIRTYGGKLNGATHVGAVYMENTIVNGVEQQ
jgi:predicted outer membrane repeat protein